MQVQIMSPAEDYAVARQTAVHSRVRSTPTETPRHA